MRNFKSEFWGIFLIILAAVVFIVVILEETNIVKFEGYFVKSEKAIRAANNAGLSEVTVLKRQCFFVAMRGGDKKDDVRFIVEGKNAKGEKVKIYVFAGWPFKAATIRTP